MTASTCTPLAGLASPPATAGSSNSVSSQVHRAPRRGRGSRPITSGQRRRGVPSTIALEHETSPSASLAENDPRPMLTQAREPDRPACSKPYGHLTYANVCPLDPIARIIRRAVHVERRIMATCGLRSASRQDDQKRIQSVRGSPRGRLFRYRVSSSPRAPPHFSTKARCRMLRQTGGAVSELCFCPHSSARRTREALDRVPLNEELTLERSDLLSCAGMHCRTL